MRQLRISSTMTDYLAYAPEHDANHELFPYGIGVRVLSDGCIQRAASFFISREGKRRFFVNRKFVQEWPEVTDETVKRVCRQIEQGNDIEVI